MGQVGREEEVRGVWCIGKNKGLTLHEKQKYSSLPPELQITPRICWPELKSNRLENIRYGGFTMGKIQEWCNVVVLQIVRCENLTSLNLQVLTCLRHLELKDLRSLKTLTFTEDGSTSTSGVYQGTHDKLKQFSCPTLQFVTIESLSSLECLPAFSPHLKFLKGVGISLVGLSHLTCLPPLDNLAGKHCKCLK